MIVPHDLLIAKLECYRIDKIDSWLPFSPKAKNKDVPQGSILGPLLSNIFINDLVFFITLSEVSNFADDNTLYSSNKELELVFRNLESDLNNVLALF